MWHTLTWRSQVAIGDTAGNTDGGRGHLEYVRATLKDGYTDNENNGVEMESRLLFKFPNLGEMITLVSDNAMIYALRGRGEQERRRGGREGGREQGKRVKRGGMERGECGRVDMKVN